MMRLGFIVVLAWVTGCAADPAALERKLLGDWHGGPCMGSITFRPDGTYERFHYSPGNYHLSGEWQVRWDALPPTLVMHCTAGDEKDLPHYFLGKVQTLNLMELDDHHLVYQYPGAGAARYERGPEPEK